MNNLAFFAFNSKQVRIVEIDGEPWFLGCDICNVLEIKNTGNTYNRLKDYEKGTIQITDGSDGNPNYTVISESGLYRLILRSRKSQAESFQDWVVQEVLPSIRKHGKYEIVQQSELPEKIIQSCNSIIDGIFSNVSIKPELIAGLKLNIAQELAPNLAPQLEQARQLLITNTAQEFELLTPTEIGKRLGLSGQAVNKKLIEMGFQVKNEDRKSKKEPAYLPIGSGKEFSDLTLATGSNGDNSSYQQLRWYSSVLTQF